jgi:hypothetical protein
MGTSITSLPVRHPHDAVREHGTYGGQGKAVRRQEAPTALLFEQVAQYKIIKIKFVASMIAITPATASTKASLASW